MAKIAARRRKLGFQKVFVQECLPNTSDKLSELSEHVKEAMEWCKVHAGDGDEDAFGQAGTTAFMAPEVVRSLLIPPPLPPNLICRLRFSIMHERETE